MKKTTMKTPQKKTTGTGYNKTDGPSSTKNKPQKRKRDSDDDDSNDEPPPKQPETNPKGMTGKQVVLVKDIPEKDVPGRKYKSPPAKKPAAKPVKKTTGTKKTSTAGAPAADPDREGKCKSMAVREKKLCRNKTKEGSDYCAVHGKNPKPPQDGGNGGGSGGAGKSKKAPAEISWKKTGNKK